jgi:hypothetical protein
MCCVSFDRGVILWDVICVLCLIVVPLPPGKNPFSVKINNNKIRKSSSMLQRTILSPSS